MISVVICTYNRCDSLLDTLKALSAQVVTNGLQLEVIVVDNNSSDRTKETVHEATGQCRWPMRYVFEPKQGLSHARNRGIQEAKGDIIAFTDDDVLPEPSWVQALAEAFDAYGADCVGGKIVPFWLQVPPAWLVSEAMQKQSWAILAMLDHGPEPCVAGPYDQGFLYGASMAFKKTVFKEQGGFRPDLGPQGSVPLRGDDTEMVDRLLRTGKRIVYTPQAVVRHKVRPERMRMAYIRRLRFQTGRSVALMSSSNGRHVPGWLAWECLNNGVGAVWAYVRRRQDSGVQCDLQFWTQLGQIVGAMQVRWNRHPQSA